MSLGICCPARIAHVTRMQVALIHYFQLGWLQGVFQFPAQSFWL